MCLHDSGRWTTVQAPYQHKRLSTSPNLPINCGSQESSRSVCIQPCRQQLLFQILTEREEKASVAAASNLPFSEWGQIIADPRLVAVLL